MKVRAPTWRDSLLATKLFAPPPRTNRVARPRLTQAFDNAVRPGHKLVLIAAPAGFGKTTIVSDWLDIQSNKTPPVRPLHSWLTLDDGDNDSARFLTYLLAALEPLAPETHEWDALVQRLSDYPPPPPVTILTPVLNHLAHTDPTPRLIVLDDYHAILPKEIHEALAFLIEHLPPHLHLVMTTRTDTPLPLARWRGRGVMTELRAGELSFTGNEAAEFLNETMNLQWDNRKDWCAP